MPLERYFQPSSATTNTTLPSSSSPAMRTAMLAMAPLETPANTPSSSRSLRVQEIASLLVTKILRSSTLRSMIGGMKPSSSERSPCTGSPCIGSAATIFTGSPSSSLRRLPAPLSVAPAPHPPIPELLLQAPAGAHQRAPRAQPRDERRDLVELFEDLDGGAVVVRVRVGLVSVLVGHVQRSE